MKNKNIVHFIFKNFSCVDYYENLILDGSLNCIFVISDLNLLKHTIKIKKFSEKVFIPYPFGNIILYVAKSNHSVSKMIIKFYTKIFKNILQHKKVMGLITTFKPNSIFVDQRYLPETKSTEALTKLLNNLELKIFTIPHAPHYRNENSIVPNKFYHSINIANTHAMTTSKKLKTLYVGYPNFENNTNKIRYSKSSDKVILLFRYFNRKDDDLCDYVEDIEFILMNIPKTYSLIINPHPSLDKRELVKIIKNCNIEKFSIVDEIPNDEYLFCISTFTTKILNIVSYQIPLIILNTTSFKFMRKWSFVDKLYSDLVGFCEDRDIFIKNINNLDSFLGTYDTQHNFEILERNFSLNAKNNFLDIVS